MSKLSRERSSGEQTYRSALFQLPLMLRVSPGAPKENNYVGYCLWQRLSRDTENSYLTVVSCLSLDAWELLDECPLTEWVTWALGFCRGSMFFLNLLFTQWQRWLSRYIWGWQRHQRGNENVASLYAQVHQSISSFITQSQLFAMKREGAT